MKKIELPDGTDEQCTELCEAMNLVPGIETVESCCGHNRTQYSIWFNAKNLESLPKLLYWFDGCHSGYHDWKVTVSTDCGMSPVHFCVRGPIGEIAYTQSKNIAKLITEYITGKYI